MKYFVFFALLAPLFFPVYSVAEQLDDPLEHMEMYSGGMVSLVTPKEPNIEFLTEWKPLPDRTMILRFGGDYYRHHILASSPKPECNGISINETKEIQLITIDSNHAWEYLISLAPVFYSNDGRTWIFLPEKKIEK